MAKMKNAQAVTINNPDEVIIAAGYQIGCLIDNDGNRSGAVSIIFVGEDDTVVQPVIMRDHVFKNFAADMTGYAAENVGRKKPRAWSEDHKGLEPTPVKKGQKPIRAEIEDEEPYDEIRRALRAICDFSPEATAAAIALTLIKKYPRHEWLDRLRNYKLETDQLVGIVDIWSECLNTTPGASKADMIVLTQKALSLVDVRISQIRNRVDL